MSISLLAIEKKKTIMMGEIAQHSPERRNMRVLWCVLGALPFFAFLFLLFPPKFRTTPMAIIQLTGKTSGVHSLLPLPLPQFSLLICVLTRADFYDRRHLLRLVYGTQSTSIASVDVKFVMCKLTKEEQRVLVALEMLRFGDVVVLNCTENMNSGKTYTFFSSLPRVLPRRYDYVMKADDDVYIRLEPLAASLAPLSRTDLYYGFVIPCASRNPFRFYMSGMGYVLSWDLVEWIATSEIPAGDVSGPEDMVVGRWFAAAGNKAKNRYNEKPAMYNYRTAATDGKDNCSHELIPSTVAVHHLKRPEQWLRVLSYFNVTKALKSSKLFDITN